MKFFILACYIICILLNTGKVFAATLPTDVSAIKDLRRALNVRLNWFTVDPCISIWEGVTCDESNTMITNISLSNKKLTGSLPPSIGNFSSLQLLDLSLNPDLGGSIPSGIGSLVHLNTLSLQGCGFTGNIPDSIGNLVNLEFLALNGNSLSGKIPSTIGSLNKLTWCDLSNNAFSGELPDVFNNMTALEHVHFNNNSFSGPIPVSISTLPNLIHLLLDNNEFSENIPPEIGNLPKLTILRLDNNQLNGSLPNTTVQLKSLLELHVSNNQLKSLPDLSRLQGLKLIRAGNISSPSSVIPPWILNMTNLITLELHAGNYSGDPSRLFTLPNLEAAYLDSNGFSGTVDFTGASETLEIVALDDNNISHVGFLPRSVQVTLSGNPVCRTSTEDYCTSDESPWTPPVNSSCKKECEGSQILLPTTCSCAFPLICTVQFISPAFTSITKDRITILTSRLSVGFNNATQIWIGSAGFTSQHRLLMNILFFPTGEYTLLDKSLVSKIILDLSTQRVKVPEFGPMLLINAIAPDTALLKSRKGKEHTVIITLGACIGAAVVIATLGVLTWCYIKKKRKHKEDVYSNRYGFSDIAPNFKSCKWFTLDELSKASNGFSNENLLGVGGYGKVYKGKLQTGVYVAIKRAEKESLQGVNEFITEIELFSRLHHKNLVKLVGFCTEEGQQILVYEFMPNRTLKDHLQENSEVLNWKTRLLIALGAAKGLEYLHEHADPPVIHRDIKSANILLDEDFVAKIADLGLSKLAPTQDGKLFVVTQVKGTLGYLDPDYYAYQQLSDKSDVYSFGVVLLEIITGKQPIDNGRFIVKEVKDAFAKDGVPALRSFLHTSLKGDVRTDEIKKYFCLALQCVEDSGQNRPKMNEVVKSLEEIIQLNDENIQKQHEETEEYPLGLYENNAGIFTRTEYDSSSSESSLFQAIPPPLYR